LEGAATSVDVRKDRGCIFLMKGRDSGEKGPLRPCSLKTRADQITKEDLNRGTAATLAEEKIEGLEKGTG